jgi:hypothetical protein
VRARDPCPAWYRAARSDETESHEERDLWCAKGRKSTYVEEIFLEEDAFKVTGGMLDGSGSSREPSGSYCNFRYHEWRRDILPS